MFAPKQKVMLLLLFWPLVFPEAQGNASEVNPVSFIGMKLDELIQNFGMPNSVYPVRGKEVWQDDVVFVYDQGDFYIFKDRVWQAGLKEVRGIKAGDPRGLVSLIMGSASGFTEAEPRGDSVLYSLNEGAWPMTLRFDFDSAARVKAIFIYRTDM